MESNSTQTITHKDNSAINDQFQANAIYSDVFIMLVED